MTNPAHLDQYELVITQANPDRQVIALLCRRHHAKSGVWAGIHAYDLNGDQEGMTLAKLVELAGEHESEQHPTADKTTTEE